MHRIMLPRLRARHRVARHLHCVCHHIHYQLLPAHQQLYRNGSGFLEGENGVNVCNESHASIACSLPTRLASCMETHTLSPTSTLHSAPPLFPPMHARTTPAVFHVQYIQCVRDSTTATPQITIIIFHPHKIYNSSTRLALTFSFRNTYNFPGVELPYLKHD
jgi:hypothetical protein